MSTHGALDERVLKNIDTRKLYILDLNSTSNSCTNDLGDRAKIINVCLLNRACLRNCF